MGPQKYVRNFRNGLSVFSAISFGPYCVRRFCASAWLRPSADDPNFASSSGMGSDFRSSLDSGFSSFKMNLLLYPAICHDSFLLPASEAELKRVNWHDGAVNIMSNCKEDLAEETGNGHSPC